MSGVGITKTNYENTYVPAPLQYHVAESAASMASWFTGPRTWDGGSWQNGFKKVLYNPVLNVFIGIGFYNALMVSINPTTGEVTTATMEDGTYARDFCIAKDTGEIFVTREGGSDKIFRSTDGVYYARYGGVVGSIESSHKISCSDDGTQIYLTKRESANDFTLKYYSSVNSGTTWAATTITDAVQSCVAGCCIYIPSENKMWLAVSSTGTTTLSHRLLSGSSYSAALSSVAVDSDTYLTFAYNSTSGKYAVGSIRDSWLKHSGDLVSWSSTNMPAGYNFTDPLPIGNGFLCLYTTTYNTKLYVNYLADVVGAWSVVINGITYSMWGSFNTYSFVLDSTLKAICLLNGGTGNVGSIYQYKTTVPYLS